MQGGNASAPYSTCQSAGIAVPARPILWYIAFEAMYIEPTLDLIRFLRPVVAAHTRRTPLVRSDWLSGLLGCDVRLKCEGLQVTGSFKARGAFAALVHEKPDAVLAASAGNHGQGLALAARTFGVPCTIVTPRSVPRGKEQAILDLGSRLIRSPFDGYDDTEIWARERIGELGGLFISPFDHPAVMAGNGGTLGLEILEDAPDTDTIVVPCGGGGCAIGLGVVVRAHSRPVRVIGVNTDASPGMALSRRDGRPHLRVEGRPTIAEGLEGGVSARSFELANRFVDDVVVAREPTLRRAVAGIALRERLVVEGSGAAGVAAVLDGLIRGNRVVIVLTGSNIDPELLAELLKEAAIEQTGGGHR